MEIKMNQTLQQYEQLFGLPKEQREDYFRYELMRPFVDMRQTINVPIKAKKPKGYEVVMATQMMGFLNLHQDHLAFLALKKLKEYVVLTVSQKTLERCLKFIHDHQLKLKTKALNFGIFLGGLF